MRIRALGVAAATCALAVGGGAATARPAGAVPVRCDYAKVRELTVEQVVAKLPAKVRRKIVKNPVYLENKDTQVKALPTAVQDRIRAECAAG
ncbi:hypothetical protein [Actinomadura gamaensis]|uniref:Hemophore-related protein n=1 Tax=Actinomadura gamaensis TaxID=1763541 RepID=A0ABV9U427_9ACTN